MGDRLFQVKMLIRLEDQHAERHVQMVRDAAITTASTPGRARRFLDRRPSQTVIVRAPTFGGRCGDARHKRRKGSEVRATWSPGLCSSPRGHEFRSRPGQRRADCWRPRPVSTKRPRGRGGRGAHQEVAAAIRPGGSEQFADSFFDLPIISGSGFPFVSGTNKSSTMPSRNRQPTTVTASVQPQHPSSDRPKATAWGRRPGDLH